MMDSSGFSLQRSNCFPAGLRVLAVDGDLACLKILEKMLKKWDYEVTACNSTQEALDLLRERKDGFDIAICDVNMPDVDGFKLPEHVGLETDIPVIMMSADGETSRVMKWVQQGACDYLLKPVRMKELQNIWQHVVRKRMHMQEARGAEGHQGADEIQMKRNGTKQSDGGNSVRGEMTCTRKRKNVENKHHDKECGDSSSTKKPRVVWNGDLHRKFVKAVNQIGPDKVGPKKILDLMGIPWLSRENVASHLQKYRLYLNRLKKEKEQIAAETKSAPSGDVIDSPMSSTSRISFNPSFGSMDSEVKSEWKMPADCSWNAEVPSIQFRQELKPHVQSEHQFDHLPLPITCFQVDPVFHCPIPSVREVDQVGNADANMFSVQLQEPIPCSLWSANNHNLEHYNIGPNLENLTLGTESSPCLWDGQFTGYPQSYFNPQNHVKFGCTNQELVADFRPYPNADGDPVDYPLTGQGLVLQDFTSY